VCVVGAGVAGIACAEVFAKHGFSVTIFEKSMRAGGLLNVIPEHRFDKRHIAKMVENLIKHGVTIEYGKYIDLRDLTLLDPVQGLKTALLDCFDYIFVAVGTQMPRILEPRTNKDIFAVDYLLGDIRAKNVAVIGGGNVAIDCAVEAVKRGGKSTVYYRKKQTEMRAGKHEISVANSHGVMFKYEVENFDVDCDLRVIAIGTDPDIPPQNDPRVFVVGDAKIGASSIAESMKHARETAQKLVEKTPKKPPK